MKKWTDNFLRRCLDGIPPCEYRFQLQRELEDHILCLARELEDSGASPEEARTQALILMGRPDELNKSYQALFVQRQLEAPFYILGRFFSLAMLTGLFYLLTWFVLGRMGFTADAVFAGRVNYPLYGHPWHQLIFGSVIFTIPFSINALYLRRAFRLHPYPGLMVTSGILFTWLCEKTVLFVLSSLLCGVSMLDILVGGWSDIAPWLNFPYILFSFLGCFVLAVLFAPRHISGGDCA